MKKFLVLYKAPMVSFEQTLEATPQEVRASTAAWSAWRRKASEAIVDMGSPLGKTLQVTPLGAAPISNDLGGYSILQAESKEALVPVLDKHPHFAMPGGVIEIVEILPQGG